MHRDIENIADKLIEHRALNVDEYESLLAQRDPELTKLLADAAVAARQKIYGNDVFVRGLIEFTNYCKNDCLYCGIRASNHDCNRYRLTKSQILECCKEGYGLGFRTFVLQGGEDLAYSDDDICDLVSSIKLAHPDCAVTLSIGERSRDSYKAYRDAGAERYLLRHETATESHYRKLHPSNMSYSNRMECLEYLRELGYQVGAGFMVSSPYQTDANIAADLKFIEDFAPDMCGIGPFIPHHATPFAGHTPGTLELTCFLLSIIRLIKPNILLPATTALGTIDDSGREKGILSGANVVMPNLSPISVRKDYQLYDNKLCTGDEAAECKLCLNARMMSIGYRIVTDRGDIRKSA